MPGCGLAISGKQIQDAGKNASGKQPTPWSQKDGILKHASSMTFVESVRCVCGTTDNKFSNGAKC